MTPTFIQQLPGDQVLYSIDDERNILPGQWLTNGNNCYPIFYSSEKVTHFIANETEMFSEEFCISGTALDLPDDGSSLLLLADNQATPIIFFLLNHLRNQCGEKQLRKRIYRILLGSDRAFPFRPVPSRFLMTDIPTGTIASSQLLEDLSLPARLASSNDLPGCFPGTLPEMLKQLNFDAFKANGLSIVAIGSSDLLSTTKKLFADQLNKQFLVKFETN